MQNGRLDESQVGIKITRRNINNLRYADGTTLMTESKEKLRNLLMRVKEKSEKLAKNNIQRMKIMTSSPITSWQIDSGGRGVETVRDFIFLGSKITADSDCSHEMKMLTLWKKSYNKPRQSIKKQRYHFADKGPSSQSYGFSISHARMWELDHKENWAVVLEKTLQHPLDSKEIQPVHPKGDQSLIFIWMTDVEPETPIFWPPDAKSWLIGKDPDGKDWRLEKGTTEDKMVGWHHQLNRHEFE